MVDGCSLSRHSANQQVMHRTQTTFSPICSWYINILYYTYIVFSYIICSRFRELIFDLTDTKQFVVVPAHIWCLSWVGIYYNTHNRNIIMLCILLLLCIYDLFTRDWQPVYLIHNIHRPICIGLYIHYVYIISIL